MRIDLGHVAGSRGNYGLSDGAKLSASTEYVGDFGVGTFSQSGGTNSIANSLYLGYNSGSNATYSLGATGQLSAAGEYVGYVAGATGLFQQAGGTNTTNFLSIGSGGRYQLSGGTLQISPTDWPVKASSTGPAAPARSSPPGASWTSRRQRCKTSAP